MNDTDRIDLLIKLLGAAKKIEIRAHHDKLIFYVVGHDYEITNAATGHTFRQALDKLEN